MAKPARRITLTIYLDEEEAKAFDQAALVSGMKTTTAWARFVLRLVSGVGDIVSVREQMKLAAKAAPYSKRNEE